MHPPYLTFRHWSGVTPYTSSYEFAGSCVFGKQSPENLSLRPSDTRRYEGRPYPEVTAAFLPSSLRTSHSFALVFSTLPPVSVCGTEQYAYYLRSFSRKRAPQIGLPVGAPSDSTRAIATRIYLSNTLIAPAPIQ